MATTTMAVTAKPAGTHVREHTSVLAAVEKRLLIWIAHRLPGWVTSDHLTALGAVAMVGTAAAFAGASIDVRWLALVPVALAVNWFGDSLDGTVARVRNQQRPRYGYYLDHVVDIANTAVLFAGLALSGLCSPWIAMALLVGYLLLSAESFLATHALGVFRISFAGVGPTELRILLSAGALAAISRPAGPSVRVRAVPVVRRRRSHRRHRHGRGLRAFLGPQHPRVVPGRAAAALGRSDPVIQSAHDRVRVAGKGLSDTGFVVVSDCRHRRGASVAGRPADNGLGPPMARRSCSCFTSR